MEYACSKGSDQYEMLSSLLGFESAKTHNIGFLKTMGCLHVNQTKCFMMIFASFMDLHSIHNLCLHGIINPCLHCRFIHKICFCLHDTPRKRAMVYTISRPIFCIPHIIIQDGFSWFSGLEGEFQGLYLWYIVKELQN